MTNAASEGARPKAASAAATGPRGGAESGVGTGAFARILSRTLAQLLPGRRGLLALPVVPAILYGGVIPVDDVPSTKLFGSLAMVVYLQLFVPLVAIAFASGLIADEAERGTLLFLLTRPVPRPVIVLAKAAAYAIAASVPLVLSIVATYAILCAKPGGDRLAEAVDLGTVLGAAVLGALAYGGLFLAIGTWLRKPLLPCLLFAFGWENVLGNIPGQTRLLSIVHYLRALVSRGAEGAVSHLPMAVPREGEIGAVAAALVLAAIAAAGLGAAIFVFSRKAYVVSRV